MPRFYETTLSITNLHNLSISTHVNRSRIQYNQKMSKVRQPYIYNKNIHNLFRGVRTKNTGRSGVFVFQPKPLAAEENKKMAGIIFNNLLIEDALRSPSIG